MKIIATALILAAALAAAGCQSSLSGSAYSRDQARTEQTVRLGVVDSVRDVTIEGTKTPIGPAAGAAVGGIAGSTVGGGKGQDLATVVGAVAGGLAGAAVEEAATRRAGLEIIVKLDSGQLIAVTQEADEMFKPGDRVKIISGRGVTRVAH
ncbi:MAG TPA: glycine zipper 2TM domain-containing protein [Pelomicrobium sp.]|nr:glycine zipper 2TM domain-containing protein [Pelomicrobium sp.]